jgi:hypothetical protein
MKNLLTCDLAQTDILDRSNSYTSALHLAAVHCSPLHVAQPLSKEFAAGQRLDVGHMHVMQAL